jgi:hypothetical protein
MTFADKAKPGQKPAQKSCLESGVKRKAPHRIAEIAAVFATHHQKISSADFDLNSNDVLAVVHDDLAQMGIEVESGKSHIRDRSCSRGV